MRWCVVLAICLATLIGSGATALGDDFEILVGEERLICTICSHVLVVELESLETEGPFTRGNPPRVRLRMIKQLKGQCEERIGAVWLPGRHDGFVARPNHPEVIADPQSLEMQAPSLGNRWLVAGSFEQGRLVVSPRFRYLHSDAMESQTRYVLEHGPAWFKGWGDDSEESAAARQAADAEAERGVDLERLCEVSTDIVLARRYSRQPGFGSEFLMLRDFERLLESPRADAQELLWSIAVDARFDARSMLRVRSSALTSKAASCLVFFKASEPPRDNALAPMPGFDPRHLVFVDPTNGMLEATPDRVEKVRQFLSRRKDKGAKPEARP